MSDTTDAALIILRRWARASATARHLAGDAETVLLQSVVDAAVTLFEAEAASIALFEPDPDRLEFRVAAGAQGAGVIGLSLPTGKGVAGYVFSTGQPIALTDVASDPRFDRQTAAQTGYVPRSIAAVPLVAAGASTGVLQVLDKRSSAAFTLRDMELMGVFARQAAAAIEAARVGRDSARLLRSALASMADGELDEDAIDALMEEVSAELDHDAEAPFWRLVDRVAQLRGASDDDLELVEDILAAVARRRGRGWGRRRG